MWKFYYGDVSTYSQEMGVPLDISSPFFVVMIACVFWGLFLKWISLESINEKG